MCSKKVNLMLDSAKELCESCNTTIQALGHGTKAEAGSTVWRGKGVFSLGPRLSRDKAGAGLLRAEISAQVISRGRRPPQIFVRPVWPAAPYRGLGGPCCVTGAIG